MKMSKLKFIVIGLITLLIIAVTSSYYLNEKVVLTLGIFVESYWDVPNDNPYAVYDAAIEKFEEEYDDVRVEYYSGFQKDGYPEYIAELALEGNMPDVFMVMKEDFPTYSEIGLLANLDYFISSNHIDLDDSFYKTSYQAGIYDEIQYALPFESVPTFMVVNTTLLEQHGLEIPDETWSWNDFYNLSESLTIDTNGDGMIDQFGSYNYTWQEAAYTKGASIFDEITGEINIDTIEFEESIYFAKKIADLNKKNAVDFLDFDKGKVAFQPMKYSDYSTYNPYPYSMKKYSDFEWNVVPLPSQNGSKEGYLVDTLLMGVSAESSNKVEAFDLLTMLCNDDEIQTLIYTNSQGVSPKISVTESLPIKQDLKNNEAAFDVNIIHDVMLNGANQYKTKNYEEIISFMDTELYRIMNSSDTMILDLALLQQKVVNYIDY